MAPRGLSQALLRAALRTQPDERLLRLGRESGGAAGEEIVRRYRQPLVRFAASIVPAQRAEDVVHDALGRALAALARGEEVKRLRPWLYTIVRNAALNDLRDEPPPHEQIDENYDGVEQPPQAQERRARLRELVAAVQGLPAAQREAIVRRELEGRSHEEIAAALGVSPGSARQLIFRARQALRQGLGSLLPMPLLRHLIEGGDGAAAAASATAAGGAVATKAAVALIAAGAVVGGGLAARDANRDRLGNGPPAAEAAAVPSTFAGPKGGGAASAKVPTGHVRSGGSGSPGRRGHGHGEGRRGGGGSAPGPGAAEDLGRRSPHETGGSPHDSRTASHEAGESGHPDHDDTRHGEDGGRSDGSSGDAGSGEGPVGGGDSESGGQVSSGELAGEDSGGESGDSGSSGSGDSGSSGSGDSGSSGSGDSGSSGSGEEGSSGAGPGEQRVATEPPPPSLEGMASDDSRDSGSGDGS
jgi:RNA polymerase sigma factor (sigma-70 family)